MINWALVWYLTLGGTKQEASEPGAEETSVVWAIHSGTMIILNLHQLTSSEVQVDGGWILWSRVTIPTIVFLNIKCFLTINFEEKVSILLTSLLRCCEPGTKYH